MLHPFLSSFALALVVVNLGACSFNPAQDFIGGHLGTLEFDVDTELSVQQSANAPIDLISTSETHSASEMRLGIIESGAADVVITGLIEEVVRRIGGLPTLDCQIPLTYRDGSLALENEWPCDARVVVDDGAQSPTRQTVQLQVSVLEFEIEKGRGDSSLQATGALSIKSASEFQNSALTTRDFADLVVAFSFTGSHVEQE